MSNRIKIFWIEPNGRFRVTTQLKSGQKQSVDCAQAEANRLFAEPFDGLVEHRCQQRLYTLPDGREVGSSELPPGACFEMEHYREIPEWCGPDGIAICVVLPNGHHWHVDGPANNCTKPADKAHRCWCRHGDPRKGELHINKEGNTCAAGAGSIQSGSYHGYLHHGYLVPA